MGALKWLRELGSNQLHGSQSPRYEPLYHPSIEIGGNIRFSLNQQLTCCHARMVSPSRVRKPRPLFRSKANSPPSTPSGITSCCQNWWTGGVTLPDSLVANEKCCFYHYRPVEVGGAEGSRTPVRNSPFGRFLQQFSHVI